MNIWYQPSRAKKGSKKIQNRLTYDGMKTENLTQKNLRGSIYIRVEVLMTFKKGIIKELKLISARFLLKRKENLMMVDLILMVGIKRVNLL